MSLPVREILNIGKSQLEEAGIENAAKESKILFCHLVNIDESKLFLEYQKTLQDIYCDKYFLLLDRRCKGEPVQYITNSQEFFGLPFFVDERVLIPRPETEVLVEKALGIIQKNELTENEFIDSDNDILKLEPKKNWSVLDLCTGSGAIGISIKKLAVGNVKVTCSDISIEALEVAKLNAGKNGVQKDIEFVHSDLLEAFRGKFRNKKFDMIISNPPYIEDEVIETLNIEVKDFEPILALSGGTDGLDFYKKIAEESPKFLNKHGVLLLEIGCNQGEDVAKLLQDSGFYNIKIIKDLTKRDRIVFGMAN